jgi:hypothetical protein
MIQCRFPCCRFPFQCRLHPRCRLPSFRDRIPIPCRPRRRCPSRLPFLRLQFHHPCRRRFPRRCRHLRRLPRPAPTSSRVASRTDRLPSRRCRTGTSRRRGRDNMYIQVCSYNFSF